MGSSHQRANAQDIDTGSKKYRGILLLVILAAFGVLSFISLSVYQDYPFCMDEYNYFYQGRIFSSGRLSLPADAKLSGLFELYMINTNGRLFSKYPPGWPLLLVPGIKLGMPGLINPLLSATTLFLIYELVVPWAGCLFALLAVLLITSNVYFLGYGASYFSQPASLFLTVLAVFFYARYGRTSARRFLNIAGLAVALLILTRPLDGLCVGTAIGFALARERTPGKYRAIFQFFFLSAIGVLILTAYNRMLTGHWGITPYNVFNSDFKVVHPGNTLWDRMAGFFKMYGQNIRDNFWDQLTNFLLPLIAFWVPFLIAGVFPRRKNKREERELGILLAVLCFLFIAFYNAHPIRQISRGWPQYGARYWYPLVLALGVCLAAGIKRLYECLPRKFFWPFMGLILIVQAGQSALKINSYGERFRFVKKITADIENQCPPKSIVFIKDTAAWQKQAPKFVFVGDLKRNPFLNGERLYVPDKGWLPSIQGEYPDYTVCHYIAPDL